jgi:hypothetical protein
MNFVVAVLWTIATAVNRPVIVEGLRDPSVLLDWRLMLLSCHKIPDLPQFLPVNNPSKQVLANLSTEYH